MGAATVTYRYAISLRLRHPTADLGRVVAALGLTPSNQWRSGEPRRSPKGRSLAGINRDSFWTARIVEGESPPGGLAAAIASTLDRIAAGAAVLKDIAESGGRCELFVGWFFASGNGGDTLTQDLLRRLADMRIDLSFDVYAVSDEAGESAPRETPS